MRRGCAIAKPDQGVVITSKDIAEKYGVEESSYEKVDISQTSYPSIQSVNNRAVFTMETPPKSLEWGKIVVRTLTSTFSEMDLHHTSDRSEVLGMFGVGMVEVVGPGVENMKKGDIVMPCESHVGMWRNYVVDSAKKFIPFPITGLKYEQLGLFQYFCLAYIMLHDCENLKPGDCVVMNSPESATGQALLFSYVNSFNLR